MSLLDMRLPNGVRLVDATVVDLEAAIQQEMAHLLDLWQEQGEHQ